ncbi:mitochondrial carrier [Punctularia strigosozonata HHB-11173 SS5]|uniref:mitochondrial carrier n=1 Tax=Punctularia strigosozonata (strain HHB-11173) TaxID=741275 RepID=UPI0004417AF1|nr:mitochondrial carrier [Punctularia strigosozonata HHB-11173 SS5]EIN08785.1 mitochondrial carrier [Punctularia strigosozonata HHB-11173 SS5]
MQAPPDLPDELPQEALSQSGAARALRDITYGSVAGMVSKVFEHPFDLTKVRLQAQVLDPTARFNGPIDCLRQTWRKEGIRGLYRGLPAPIVGAMAENATLFLSYNELQSLIRRISGQTTDAPTTLPQIALAAAGAGGITATVLTPIELVKCKMQVQMLAASPHVAPSAVAAVAGLPLSASMPVNSSTIAKLPGPISVLMSVIREHGVRGLWLGHTGTLLREIGGGAAWFCTKEFVAGKLISYRLSKTSPGTLTKGKGREAEPLAYESAISGAFAGAAYNIALFPADTVKSALQTAQELHPNSHQARLGYLGMAKEMWSKQGIRGMYAGCGVTIARSIPSSAIIFLIYDGLKGRFG